jgi:peptide-methionine (S)-S-oxide reductase
MLNYLLTIFFFLLTTFSFSQKSKPKFSYAYFASGCFWCVEAIFESVKGVEEAESGYAGGKTKNPTYEDICTGNTGHAETVKVKYDSTVITYKDLLRIFFNSHDPTTLNQQGPDKGTQYRSAIFYRNQEEKLLAEKYINELLAAKKFPKITTTLEPFTTFYIAESYHQDFERRNPNHPYIQAVSLPRLRKFQAKAKDLLKN